MNRQEFEKDVSAVLATEGNYYFEVYMKGVKIYAEAYEIEIEDTVILYNHNAVTAVARISEIIGVG